MIDLHVLATYAIIVGTIIAYLSDRFSIEVVALVSLGAFIALFSFYPMARMPSQALDAQTLLTGFSNPALATVQALLIVGQGLFATDALDYPARFLTKLGGRSIRRTTIITLLTAAGLSAFLNNTPVVVIFIPIVVVLAAQRSFPAAQILMPLSFITILGGMTTMIGSSTNLLVAGISERQGVKVNFFDLTLPGLVLAGCGALYILFIMPHILSRKGNERRKSSRKSGAQFIAEIKIDEDHPFLGMRARAGLFPELKDLTPRVIMRHGAQFLPPFEDMEISLGDQLAVSGTKQDLIRAMARGAALPSEGDEEGTRVLTASYRVIETIVPPGSRHSGQRLGHADIESLHGVDVLGVQRKSRMNRVAMGDIRLEPGDTLLIGADEAHLLAMRQTSDLVVLEWSAQAVPQRRKAGIAVAIFLMVILSAAFNITSIAASSIIGAILMIMMGCLTFRQATRAFDVKIYLLVGSSIAAATALERTGGTTIIVHDLLDLLAGYPPIVLLSCLFLLVAILTNMLSNNATAVLFTPIALEMARQTGSPPHAFVAAVIFAANASFATPMGYQTNMLVMGPGGYSFSDYMRAGIPLVLLVWVVFIFIAPYFYTL